jgi:hypothetical protein
MGKPSFDCAADRAIEVPIPTLTMQTVAVAAMAVPRVKAEPVRRSDADRAPTTAETTANGEPAAAVDTGTTEAADAADATPVEPTAVATATPTPPATAPVPLR